jgi:cold shock CspA family protein
MREIGFVKWFGGYDSTRGRENNFGYIQREDGSQIKVYREQVRCEETCLSEGILVTFNVKINPQTNKAIAKNLNLFKEVGKLKNFCNSTHPNNYWFIDSDYQDNILVHKKEINCSELDLQSGRLVKFELQQDGNECKAINVHLLNKEETDSDIIERCLSHKDPRFCAFGLWGYLNNHSLDEAVSLASQKLNRYALWEKRRFLRDLPEPISLYFEVESLTPVLPDKDQRQLFLQILRDDFTKEIDDSLREDIFNIINKSQNLNLNLCNKVINKLYELYLDAPEHRKKLNQELQIKCLIELISHVQNDSHIKETLLNDLQDILEVSASISLWGVIPNYIILEKQIWTIAPRDRRIGILVSQISNQKDLSHQDKFLEIAKILEESALEEIPSLISIFQDKYWIKSHDAILIFLPSIEQITILVEKFKNNVNDHEFIIARISQLLTENLNNNLLKLLSLLSESVKKCDEILEFLPAHEKVNILLSKLKKEDAVENKDIILKIGNILKTFSIKEQIELIERLPKWLKYQEPILQCFSFLPPDEQVNLIWSLIESDDLSFWRYLSRKAKIMCVYRLEKESKNTSNFLNALNKIIKSYPENDSLVRCVLNIIWVKENQNSANQVFQKVHDLLTDYVIQQAKTFSEAIDIDPLLPLCKPKKVKYCVAKPWARDEDKQLKTNRVSLAYCPRLRTACDLFDSKKTDNSSSGLSYYGARLYADCSQDWRDWSLLELFEIADIVPKIKEMEKPEDYVPKLSGWVNRINEIRLRLKCSVCEDTMPHHPFYATFQAKFRVTVFSCKHGIGHDRNIYLNDCWGCEAIIDSRESKYKSPEKRYYICIHCGSGAQYSNIYTQGDICPKCGTPAMTVSKGNYRYRQCRSCNHQIKLPKDKKITGPQCPQCGTRGMMLTVNEKNQQVRVCRSCGYTN